MALLLQVFDVLQVRLQLQPAWLLLPLVRECDAPMLPLVVDLVDLEVHAVALVMLRVHVKQQLVVAQLLLLLLLAWPSARPSNRRGCC